MPTDVPRLAPAASREELPGTVVSDGVEFLWEIRHAIIVKFLWEIRHEGRFRFTSLPLAGFTGPAPLGAGGFGFGT